jgi:RNA polymerase sigma-70 factor (ECF subfamily)
VRHFACRVALLTALNARRRFQLRERLTPSATPQQIDQASGDERFRADLLAERRRSILLGLLDELPPAQAEAIAMHCVLGYTVAETAQATGVPPNTVRGRLVSAKAALRQALALDTELKDQLRAWSRGAS